MAEQEYRLSPALMQQIGQLQGAVQNLIAGARLQMGVPPHYVMNPQTGEFVAPQKPEKPAERKKT